MNTSVVSIERWSRVHAGAMLSATLVCLLLGRAWPLGVAGLLSFGGYVLSNRPLWQEHSRWGGPANLVTSLRVLLLCWLAGTTLPPLATTGLALGVLVSDGLDGYLARRYGVQSLFGAYFDKETDAFYVMVLSTMLYTTALAPAWVLGLGLIRYVYVLLLIYFKPPTRSESRSYLGQVIAVAVMLALAAGFILPAAGRLPVLAGTGLLVLFSFGRSFAGLRHVRNDAVDFSKTLQR
ncbi:MAG: hypothetical protein OHK0039_04320 [Bacteroidia bacterium]